jgi:hypothetical protein
MTSEGLNEDFLDMLDALRDAEVEFLVVGAHAMAAHGVARATGDIDLFVRANRENADRIIRALQAFGAPLKQHGVSADDFEAPDVVYQIGLPPRRIDLLTSISGVSFDEAWASRTEHRVHGRSVAFLGRAMLVQNKRATGREKDLVDVHLLDELAARSPKGGR